MKDRLECDYCGKQFSESTPPSMRAHHQVYRCRERPDENQDTIQAYL